MLQVSALPLRSAFRRLGRVLTCCVSVLVLATSVRAQNVATFGGAEREVGYDVAVDATGNAVVVGSFEGTVDFDPGPGVANRTSVGQTDAFVARYTARGAFVSVTTFGGAGLDAGHGVAVDGSGNAVVTGFFSGTVDFDPSAGDASRGSVNTDVFVARYDENGNFVSVVSFGGPDHEMGSDVTVDAAGSVIVTGTFNGPVDFDPGTGTAIRTTAGMQNGFVARFDAGGGFVSVATFGGPGGPAVAEGVALDGAGNAVVTGHFFQTADFDPGPGSVSRTSAGMRDVFVVRYAASGALVSVVTLGGESQDYGYSVAIDGAGHAVVVGAFRDRVDFDPGPGTVTRAATGQFLFVARYDATGGLVSVATVGGLGTEFATGAVTVDTAGNAIVTGSLIAEADFDPSARTALLRSAGSYDVFVARYTPNGGFVSATAFGGSGPDVGHGVAVDGSGNAVVTGSFTGTVDFDPGADNQGRTSAGVTDGFVARYTPQATLSTGVLGQARRPLESLTLFLSPSPAVGLIRGTLVLPEHTSGANMRVLLFDALGREVARLHEGNVRQSTFNFTLDASRHAPGVYLVRAEVAGASVLTRSLVVTR
jgi:hypothetical protein